MDYEQALKALSARLDGELTPDQEAQLTAYLEANPSFAATADAFRLQHHDLKAVLAERRRAADRTADKVAKQLQPRTAKRPRLAVLALAAALIGVAVLGVTTFTRWKSPRPNPSEGPVVASLSGLLTPRPRPEAVAPLQAEVGQTVETAEGQRTRVALPDGSIAYLDHRSRLRVLAADRVELERGEVFVEVAHRASSAPPFVLATPHRQFTALGTRFAVTADAQADALVVTQGKVKASDVSQPIVAGQELPLGSREPRPAERASARLQWLRDLLAASVSPLIPASKHAGGALIAKDPYGGQAELELRDYKIDVHVEDGFARTTIDQTYFNHAPSRLEGTFFFPLPPDASLSRLAMYVNGQLMEGGMAERNHARTVYETIRDLREDPALLEWVDGSTFKMRVFPLEARQEKRIILSYTQKLTSLYGKLTYRFPAGHNLNTVARWSFHGLIKGYTVGEWTCPSHPQMRGVVRGSDLILDAQVRNARLNRDVVLEWTDSQADVATRFTSAEHENHRYLMLRHRPTILGKAERQRRDWFFLFESSGDRDPLLARVQVELIRSLLTHAEADDTFTVLTAGTRVKRLNERSPVTSEHVQAAIGTLEKSHLIGALDLGRALSDMEPSLASAPHPVLVHLGSGVPALGERRHEVLAQRLPPRVQYVGIGVGQKWNRAFMKQVAERSGGFFTQVNPDEAIAWRGFDLLATLNTPRWLDVKVEASGANSVGVTFLGATSLLNQGEEITAVARVPKTAAWPETVVISGKQDGKPVWLALKVDKVQPKADYLPRTWAKLEIDRLLAEDSRRHKPAIIDLSKAMYVMSPFTSLLVLENDAMYDQYKVDRGRKDHWAMYPAPAQIEVHYEPEDPNAPRVEGRQPTEAQVRQTLPQMSEPKWLTVDREPLRPAARSWGQVVDPRTVAAARRGLRCQLVGTIKVANRLIRNQREISARLNRFPADGPDSSIDGLVDVDQSISIDVERLETVDLGEAPAADTMDAKFTDRETLMPFFAQRQLGFSGGIGGFGGASQKLGFARSAPQLTSIWTGQPPQSYERPRWEGSIRFFTQLVRHAPGLSNTPADERAVLAVEAAPRLTASRPAVIHEAARRLIDQSRQLGWQRLTLSDGRIVFDGTGRYVAERQLPFGLREQIVCDGVSLWHLYGEIGLAAQRSVSRFHREELAEQLPDFLPPVADLAIDHDVLAVNDHTVALVPRNRKTAMRTHLVFDPDGRLIERHTLSRDGQTLQSKLVIGPDAVRLYDDKGTMLAETKRQRESAESPTLKPNLDGLVVVPMPVRTPEFVFQQLDLKPGLHPQNNGCYQYLEAQEQERLFFALALRGQDQDRVDAARLFVDCLQSRDRRAGWYVLLQHMGQAPTDYPSFWSEWVRSPENPLWTYLAVTSSRSYAAAQRRLGLYLGDAVAKPDQFLGRLVRGYDLLQRGTHSHPRPTALRWRDGELDRTVAFVQANPSALGWVVTDQLHGGGSDRAQVACYTALMAVPELARAARYERAVLWSRLGDKEKTEARREFRKLYFEALLNGELLPVDSRFRDALRYGETDNDDWTTLMRETVDAFTARGLRSSAVLTAWQCWQLNDQALALNLLSAIVASTPASERSETLRAAIEFYRETRQAAAAEPLMQELLNSAEGAKDASLWRLASELANQRRQWDRAVVCLEKAHDLELAGSAAISADTFAMECTRMLQHYLSLAEAVTALKLAPPIGLAERTVKVADRWRSLDPAGATSACWLAAQVLREMGETELAWEYQTTPIAYLGNDVRNWQQLARQLANDNELALADKAYEAAVQADPTNASLLWDRAMNLQQMGRTEESKALLREIAQGEWRPRFNGLKSEAKWRLGQR